MKKLNVGLYGDNGHQIFTQVKKNGSCRLAAIAGMSKNRTDSLISDNSGLRLYGTLDEMIADPDIDLISLCSPSRAKQAADAIAVLRGGKHVYAEKPAALSEVELDEILSVAAESGKEFHEMATSAYEEPFFRLKKFMEDSPLGEIIQIYVQKSYRMLFDTRPQDDETDGGLIRWVGIHAVRFIEHIVGVRVDSITAVQTRLGNPIENGGLHTACACMMTLENGGIASACINYLNPKGFGQHGNETIRIFGSKGMAEVIDGGRGAHVYMENGESYELPVVSPPEFFDMYVSQILENTPMPFTLEDELHPLRIVIRAHDDAERRIL